MPQFVTQEDVFAGAKTIDLPAGLFRAIYLSIDGTATASGLMSTIGIVRVDHKGLPLAYVDFQYLDPLTDMFQGFATKTEGATTAFGVELPLVYPWARGSVLFREKGEAQLFFPKPAGDHTAANLEVYMVEGEEEETHKLSIMNITKTLGGQRSLEIPFKNVVGVVVHKATTTDPTRIIATKDGRLIQNSDWTELCRQTSIAKRKEAAVTTYGYINFMGRSNEPSTMLSDQTDIQFTGGSGTITGTILYATFDAEAMSMSRSMVVGRASDAVASLVQSQGPRQAHEAITVLGNLNGGSPVARIPNRTLAGASGGSPIYTNRTTTRRTRSLPF